jgi:hypothetical protein
LQASEATRTHRVGDISLNRIFSESESGEADGRPGLQPEGKPLDHEAFTHLLTGMLRKRYGTGDLAGLSMALSADRDQPFAFDPSPSPFRPSVREPGIRRPPGRSPR